MPPFAQDALGKSLQLVVQEYWVSYSVPEHESLLINSYQELHS